MHPSFNHIQVDPRTGEIIKADIRMGEGSGRQFYLIPSRILESQLAMTWVMLMNWLEAHKLPTNWRMKYLNQFDLDVFNFSISATWLLHSGWVWAWLKELDLMAPNITHAQRVALLASHRLTLGTPSREIRILWDMFIVVDDLNIWQNEPAA